MTLDSRAEAAREGRPTPHEILRSMLVPDKGPTFLLGCFEKRVTLFHQQVRALNLVYALNALGHCRGARVAVVGAGVAGLTAAAALARVPGCKVVLLERKDRILSILDRGLETGRRFLDPVLYEWPDVKPSHETFYRASGSTPLTGWPAGLQSSVVEWFGQEWDRVNGGVRVELNAQNVSIRPGAENRLRLEWVTQAGTPAGETFDLAILAIGFGHEQPIVPLAPHPYWEDDDLDDLPPDVGSCLVSGAGDGGWTDVFRLVIPGFRQDKMRAEFLSDDLVPRKVRDRLMEIEGRARLAQTVGRDPDHDITTAYMGIETPDLVKLLKDKTRDRRRRIVLNAPENYLLRGSFIANRFLGSRLVQANIVELWPGRIAAVGGPDKRSPFTVVLTTGESRVFDRVVIRHGPDPALKAFDPGLFESCHASLRTVAQIDRTCLPAWPTDDFDYGEALRSAVAADAWFGTGDTQARTADAIEEYRRRLRERARARLPEIEQEPVNLSVRTPAGSPVDAAELERHLDAGGVVLSYDPWDRNEVEAWAEAASFHAYTDPGQIGLRRQYLPLRLPGWWLRPGDRDPAESVVAALRDMYGFSVGVRDLQHWPRQADIRILAILDAQYLEGSELETLFRGLRDALGPDRGFYWVVLEAADARAGEGAGLGLQALALSPSDGRPSGPEVGEAERMIVGRLREMFPPRRVTWPLLRAALKVLEPDRSDGIWTRASFGAAYLERVLSQVAGGTPGRDSEFLTAIAHELWRDHENRSPRVELRDRLAKDFPDESAEAIEGALDRLIAAKILSREFKTNPFQEHLRSLDPYLGMPDQVLGQYLAARYLAADVGRLEAELRESRDAESWNAVLEWAILIAVDPGTAAAREPVFALLTQLSGRAEDRKAIRVLARILAVCPDLLDVRSEGLLDRFCAGLREPTRTDFEVAELLAGRHERVRRALLDLAGPQEGRKQWVRVAAARAVWIGGGVEEGFDRLLEFARPAGGLDDRSALLAVEALYDGGRREQAVRAAHDLAGAEGVGGAGRVRAAELAGKWDAGGSRDALRRLAKSDSPPVREGAAMALQRLGDRAAATEAFWALLEEAGPCGERHRAADRLIGAGEHRSRGERMRAAFERIASDPDGIESGTDRAWAAARLEQVGAVERVGASWLAISRLGSLAPDERIKAAVRGLEYSEVREAAVQALAEMAGASDLPVASRLGATRALLESSAGGRLPAGLLLQLRGVADSPDQAPEDRATAAALWAIGDQAPSPAAALHRLAQSGGPELRLACVSRLIELQGQRATGPGPFVDPAAGSVARRLLLALVTDERVSQETRNKALWKFASLREWDELVLAAELGEIRGASLETALSVLGEMGQWNRAFPLIRRMVMEPPPWPEGRTDCLFNWTSRNPQKVPELLDKLGSLPSAHLAHVRQALGQSADRAIDIEDANT